MGFTCPLCGSGEADTVQTGARHAPEALVRCCRGCGLVFLWPQPQPDELARYYRELYRPECAAPTLAARHAADLPEAELRLSRIEPWLTPESRILEIGSGSGAFLSCISSRVAEAAGVEPEEQAREWIATHCPARVCADIQELENDAARFDLIALFHVLEHVPDPVRFLERLARLLCRGGRLIAEVPNVEDALVSRYRVPAYLSFYFQRAHLYYFSAATLGRAFRSAGIRAEITGFERYTLSNHIHWMLDGKPGGQHRFEALLDHNVETAYAQSLIRSGASDTLWAVGYPLA
jgi:SAM-dependent methyltransferase